MAKTCTPRIGSDDIAPQKKIIVLPGCTFVITAPRAPRNFDCAPAFTEFLPKTKPVFRDFLLEKPARTGGTYLSDHIGEYPPPGNKQSRDYYSQFPEKEEQ